MANGLTAAQRGVFSTIPKTEELKAFFSTAASGRGELDDIRGSKGAGRRLAPAIKMLSGKILKGEAGKDTHNAIAHKHGVTMGGADNQIKTTGFVDKRSQKFIGRAKAFLKFGIADSLELFDPRKLGKVTFGAGFLGGLVAPEILDIMNRGPLFQREQFGPEA